MIPGNVDAYKVEGPVEGAHGADAAPVWVNKGVVGNRINDRTQHSFSVLLDAMQNRLQPPGTRLRVTADVMALH